MSKLFLTCLEQRDNERIKTGLAMVKLEMQKEGLKTTQTMKESLVKACTTYLSQVLEQWRQYSAACSAGSRRSAKRKTRQSSWESSRDPWITSFHTPEENPSIVNSLETSGKMASSVNERVSRIFRLYIHFLSRIFRLDSHFLSRIFSYSRLIINIKLAKTA